MLEFERPFLELESKIQELKSMPSGSSLKIQGEILRLEKKGEKLLKEIYGKLTPWQKVLVARHENRPKTQDYVHHLMDTFIPLSGDRCFSEDLAITAGLASFRGHSLIVMGHEKGKDTQSRVEHNFGMAHPEGYRKVERLLELAHRFALPVLFLVDTPGSYAGIAAEERGQSQALASCIEKSLCVRSPIFSIVIGEGGSGGAVAMATANGIYMLEHSVYSVISPEGCAAILWRTADKKEEASTAQKLTAQDLLGFHLIDGIIPEPLGGAHRSPKATMDAVGNTILAQLQACQKDPENILEFQRHRRDKFLAMGTNL